MYKRQLQIQQEPMRPLPLAPGCERGASRGTKERTPADPAGKCGATFEQSENGAASTLPPAGAMTCLLYTSVLESGAFKKAGKVYVTGAATMKAAALLLP